MKHVEFVPNKSAPPRKVVFDLWNIFEPVKTETASTTSLSLAWNILLEFTSSDKNSHLRSLFDASCGSWVLISHPLHPQHSEKLPLCILLNIFYIWPTEIYSGILIITIINYSHHCNASHCVVVISIWSTNFILFCIFLNCLFFFYFSALS